MKKLQKLLSKRYRWPFLSLFITIKFLDDFIKKKDRYL